MTFSSGLVSLAMEVLWTRVLLQATGSSIYIFVAVLAVFLIGIAGGSLVYERHKIRTPQVTTLGACLAGAAALTLVPVIVSNLDGPSELPVVVLLIVPVTALLGYAFPLTVRLFVETAGQASRGVGLLYAANTAGCVVGTVVAGFVLIPTLGTLMSIVLLCIFEAVLGAGLAIVFAVELQNYPRSPWDLPVRRSRGHVLCTCSDSNLHSESHLDLPGKSADKAFRG